MIDGEQPAAADYIGSDGIIDTRPDKSSLSPKELKKLEKAERALQKKKNTWKVFVDFLLRHMSIVTTKFAAWEKDEFAMFKAALDKAQRLDDKDSETTARTYKKLKERAEILSTKRYFGECNRIRKYIDMVARMRCLNLIARDFYKSIKKGKLEPLENVLNHLQYWKGFTVASFDLGEVSPKGVEPNDPTTKYVIWVCLVRTLLNLGQKFLQGASELTEIPLVSASFYVSFNLTAEQLIVGSRLEELLATHVSKATGIQSANAFTNERSLNFSGMASSFEGSRNRIGYGAGRATQNEPLPGEGEHLTFELPPEPPKDKKKGKKGKKKKKGSGKKKKKK